MDYTQWLLGRYPRNDELAVLALAANYEKISDAARAIVHAYIVKNDTAMLSRLRATARAAKGAG